MEKQPVSFYIVRFNDCDPFGHLNNSKYIDYFLNAREDHLRDFYQIDLKDWAGRGITFVVNKHEIQYVRPVLYNEKIAIRSRLIGYGEETLQVEMLMYDHNHQQLKAILWTNFTRINTKTGRKDILPPEALELATAVITGDVDMTKGIADRVFALQTVTW